MLNIKVSICIPTYNQADYIELSIRSAVEQTYSPFEIIVSDDCSTDNTKNILNDLSLKIPNLKVIYQPVNLGIARNVDTCLRYATGDYIIRLDSDDQLLPGYTEGILKIFVQYPNAGYAHTAVQEIDQNGRFLNQRKLIRESGFQDWKTALKNATKGYRVAANILMFRKDALVAVNYLDGLPNFAEDYYLTASISANGFGNVYIDEIFACYRVWIDATKVRQKRKLAEINGIRRVFEDVLEPAYIKNNFKLNAIKKNKANFACEQSDCLSWEIYTLSEKQEIKAELNKLSSAPVVGFYIWMYSEGFGNILNAFSKLKSLPKSLLKASLKKHNIKNVS